MGIIDEGFKCQEDEDCPSTQYCYKISKRCVNYTICNRYHRVESQMPARQPSQCGSCMKGYFAETLATGEDVPYCKKISDQTNLVSKMDSGLILILIIVVLTSLILLAILGYKFYKKWISKKQEPKTYEVQNVESDNAYNESTAPSAPPKEKSPFIDKVKYHDVPHNNNKILTYDDKHQTTRAFFPPDWVSNANYGTNEIYYNSDEINNQERAVQHLVNNDNSNNHNQPSEQFAVEMLENDIQYEDNAGNTALLQAYPSNHNGSNTDNNSDDNSDYTPSPSENENRRNKKRNVYINQSVNQNITMNVRLINED